MFHYTPIRGTHSDEENGEYISYGICVTDDFGTEVCKVCDVSLSLATVEDICEKATRLLLLPHRLYEIIEDRIA